MTGFDGAAQCGEQLLRRVEIRQALREVDAADLGAQARHLADHGLLERAGAPRQPELVAGRRAAFSNGSHAAH